MNINFTARKMNSLAKKKIRENNSEPSCVHKNLTLRTLVMLKYIRPESESVFAPIVKNLVPYSKRPDKKGDYENGMGRHYYCAASPSGREQSAINGYFKNGIGRCCKSARTMLEEDYTMALTMYIAGFYEKSAEFLGRALHMLSDIFLLHAAFIKATNCWLKQYIPILFRNREKLDCPIIFPITAALNRI